MADLVLIQTSVPSRPIASRIATLLIDQRLAACVQIVGPVASTFRWKGKVVHAREWLCVVKTRRSMTGQVERAVTALHHDEVPEFLVLPVEYANAAYLRWVQNEIAGPARSA